MVYPKWQFVITAVDAELELNHRVNGCPGAPVIRVHLTSAYNCGGKPFLYHTVGVDRKHFRFVQGSISTIA